jgi:2-polyprenyl-3-methyl-5-hydroxy-6-metoxy-1,4-benzoquinol methylase
MDETADWHESQDTQVTDVIDRLSVVQNSDSPIIRLGALSEDLLHIKHVYNIACRQKKNATFSVFDLGCGQGDILEKIGLLFPNAELNGLDSNKASIDIARKRCPQASLAQGVFSDVTGVYDVVICCEVFEHVEDYQGLLDKLYEITKPGGLLTISTPSGWMYRDLRRFTVETAIRNWSWYKRNCLEPEKNWKEALNIHPAIFPKKLIRLCERRGFVLLTRQSSLWHLQSHGWPMRFFNRWALRSPNKASISYANLVAALDGLMNSLPFLRIKETRFILGLQKPLSFSQD